VGILIGSVFAHCMKSVSSVLLLALTHSPQGAVNQMLKSVGCLESLSSFFNSMNNLSYSTDSYLPVMTVTL